MYKKVLLVDDEPLALEGLKLVVDWGSLGYQIHGECGNGEEALDLIEKNAPDLVITDIRMPSLDGLGLIKRVKEQMRSNPIFIIVSGYDEFEYARKALRLGIKHYLLKPVFPEELTEVLLGILASQAMADGSALGTATPWPSQATANGTALGTATPWPSQATANGAVLGTTTSWPSQATANGSVLGTTRPWPSPATASGSVLGAARPWQPQATADGSALGAARPWPSPATANGSVLRTVAAQLEMAWPSYATKDESVLRSAPAGAKSEVNPRSSGPLLNEIAYLETIVEAMDDLNLEKMETGIDSAFTYFAAIQPPPEILKMYVINIIYHGIGLINEMNGSSTEFVGKYHLNRLDVRETTLKEWENILQNYCAECCVYLKSLKSRDSQINIYKIEAYLRENFKRNLTIKEISKNFYLHPAYLGQLFLKKFGTSFNEYLHKMRIEEAMRMIDSGSMKTYEIAMEVGYNSYHSFLQNFEKYAGVKPAEYKKVQNERYKD